MRRISIGMPSRRGRAIDRLSPHIDEKDASIAKLQEKL